MSFQKNSDDNDFPKEVNDFFNFMGSNGSSFRFLVLLLLFLFVARTCFYTVGPSEEAVVTRFGKYERTTSPGLHFLLPLWVEVATKVDTKLILQEEFGFRTRKTDTVVSSYSKDDYSKESLMLTGDLNVADVEWIVQYQISDPKKYLFVAQDPKQNIRDVSEAIMRRVVGDRTVNEVLTTGRVEIANSAKQLTQEVLDKYDLGIRIVAVMLQDVNPPDLVQPSFNEVNAAKQEQEQAINVAEEAYNKIIPEARGKADETISQAEGYASAVVNRAQGDTEKFLLTLKEYRQAPEITRTRMYLETMQEIYKQFKNITIVDDKVKGILPIFNTGEKKELNEKP